MDFTHLLLGDFDPGLILFYYVHGINGQPRLVGRGFNIIDDRYPAV